MPLKPLIASHYTVAGLVRPLEGSVASPVDPRDRMHAALAAGFDGVGFEYDDLAAWSDRVPASQLGSAARDAGIAHIEIEVLSDWYCSGDARVKADQRRDALFAVAEKIGARLVKVLGGLDRSQEASREAYAEGFAILCQRAAEHGLDVAIELYPGSPLRSPAATTEIIRLSGARNGGLLIDNWHMWHGGISMTEIAALPGSVIKHVELSDGPAILVGSLLEDTLLRRELPGEGEFPVQDFLRAIEATGYSGAYGVEIISETHRALPVDVAATRAYAAGRTQLDLLTKEVTP